MGGGDGKTIYYDQDGIQHTTVTIEQIVEKLTSLATQVNSLPFGENASHQSSGPCASEMATLTVAYRDTLLQMVATITRLVEYIRSGAENMDEIDKYLASQMATVSLPPRPNAIVVGGSGNSSGERGRNEGGGGQSSPGGGSGMSGGGSGGGSGGR